MAAGPEGDAADCLVSTVRHPRAHGRLVKMTFRDVDPATKPQAFEGTTLSFEDGQIVVWAEGGVVARLAVAHVAAVELAGKTYTVDGMRTVHPRAYARWTEAEEQELLARLAKGASMAELVHHLGRGMGAIGARLDRLGAVLRLATPGLAAGHQLIDSVAPRTTSEPRGGRDGVADELAVPRAARVPAVGRTYDNSGRSGAVVPATLEVFDGSVEAEQSHPLVVDAQDGQHRRNPAGHRRVPQRGLKRVQPTEFDRAQEADVLDLAPLQGLRDDPVDGAPAGVAQLLADLLICPARRFELDGARPSPGRQRGVAVPATPKRSRVDYRLRELEGCAGHVSQGPPDIAFCRVAREPLRGNVRQAATCGSARRPAVLRRAEGVTAARDWDGGS